MATIQTNSESTGEYILFLFLIVSSFCSFCIFQLYNNHCIFFQFQELDQRYMFLTTSEFKHQFPGELFFLDQVLLFHPSHFLIKIDSHKLKLGSHLYWSNFSLCNFNIFAYFVVSKFLTLP